MRHDVEHHANRGRGPPIERQHAMGRYTGKERARLRFAKEPARKPVGRPGCLQSESRERKGMAGPAERTKHRMFDSRPGVDHRPDEPAITVAIATESVCGSFN